MELNSIRGGAISGIAIVFVAAAAAFWLHESSLPPRPAPTFNWGPSGQIVPPEPEPPLSQQEIRRRDYVDRLAVLLGDTRPDNDFAGDVENGDIADREKALARSWCTGRVAKFYGISEAAALASITDGERGDIDAGRRVLVSLERTDPADVDRARVRQCAGLLYLGATL